MDSHVVVDVDGCSEVVSHVDLIVEGVVRPCVDVIYVDVDVYVFVICCGSVVFLFRYSCCR